MGSGGEKKQRKTMIEVLLALQESEPEYYKDEIIRGIMLVSRKIDLVLQIEVTDTN